MAIRPEDVAPDAVFTQTPPAPPTPQPDGRDRSTWNGWPSRNTAQPRVIIDDQERITRIRTPVMDLEGHMTPTHLFYVVQHFAVPEPIRPEDWQVTIDGEVQQPGDPDLRRPAPHASPHGAHGHGVLGQRCELLRVF